MTEEMLESIRTLNAHGFTVLFEPEGVSVFQLEWDQHTATAKQGAPCSLLWSVGMEKIALHLKMAAFEVSGGFAAIEAKLKARSQG